MIGTQQYENVTVVRPNIDRLDAVLGRQLISEMREYLAPRANVLLDLAAVKYLNSEAIGFITTCARRQRHRDGGLAVCGLQDGPREVFKTLRMEQVLAGIYDSVEDALTAFKQPVRH